MGAETQVTWADACTAIGTVGAVLVALAIAGWPSLSRRFGSRLKLVTGLGEPFLRPIPRDRGIGFDEVRLRVGVRNSRRSAALDIEAVLRNWWEFDADVGKWKELDLDPLPMKWISIPPADDRQGRPPSTSILPRSVEYLDLIIWRNTEIELVVDDGRQVLFYASRVPALGRWRLQFAVSGSNRRLTRHTVEFECDGKNFISRSEASRPPKNAQHVGLFNLLRSGELER